MKLVIVTAVVAATALLGACNGGNRARKPTATGPKPVLTSQDMIQADQARRDAATRCPVFGGVKAGEGNDKSSPGAICQRASK